MVEECVDRDCPNAMQELIQNADRQLLVHEETAQIITNAIAIATTLALPRILILIQLGLPCLVRATHRLNHQSEPDRQPGRLTSHVLQTFQSAESIGSMASKLVHRHLGMPHIEIGVNKYGFRKRYHEIWANFLENRWAFSVLCLAVLALGALYIAIQTIAVLTAGIVSNSFGVSSLSTCGQWLPLGPLTNETTPGPVMITADGEYEAIAYAETYYGTASPGRRTSEYARQKIDYQIYQNRPCPFAHEYCVGNNSALVMDTGMQSTRVLGINTAEQYFFRKEVTCAPLITQNSNASSSQELRNGIELHYQARSGDPYVAMQVLKRERCERYGYQTRYAFTGNKGMLMLNVSSRNFMLPVNIKEGIPRVPTLDIIRQGYGSDFKQSTLFFIKSCGVLYLGPSSDPVFPAEFQNPSGYWSPYSQYPRALGCQESRAICNSDGACLDLEQLSAPPGHRWPFFERSFKRTTSETAVLELLALSLSFSNIGHGDSPANPGLFAERLHSGSLSIALGNEHWQTEIRWLFEISLARLQGTTVDLAWGKNSGKPGYGLAGNHSLEGACSSVKISTTGWRNLSLTEMVSYSVFLLSLWISTVKYGERILLVQFFRLLMGSQAQECYAAIKNRFDNLVLAIYQRVRARL